LNRGRSTQHGESLFLLLVRLLSFVEPLVWFLGEDRVCRPGRPAETAVNLDVIMDLLDACSFSYSHRQIPTMGGKIGSWNNILALAKSKQPVWSGSRPSLMNSKQFRKWVSLELEWMGLTRVQSYNGNTAIVHIGCNRSQFEWLIILSAYQNESPARSFRYLAITGSRRDPIVRLAGLGES